MAGISFQERLLGKNQKPFIIAEMSGNHNQSLDRALAIVDAAATAGADAIKLQTYIASTMTLPGVNVVEDANSLWVGRELYELYQEAHTPWDWHAAIFERAKQRGIYAFSSPFDESSVDFLETLNVPAYKIASLENTDLPLLKKVASTSKPVIMSTGASTVAEIDEAVTVLRNSGCQDIILLKCTMAYPASPAEANLNTLPHLASLFNVPVGLSDHTMGLGVSIAAVALGARVIEKHFTLNRADGGVDSAFSLEPNELAALVSEATNAHLALGTVHYGLTSSEVTGKEYKRSIYAAEDIKAGEALSKSNVRIIRPGKGLAPKFIDVVLGRPAKSDIKKGTPITFDLI